MAPLKKLLPRTLTWRFGLLIVFLSAFSLVVGTQAAIDTNANTRCLAQYAQRQAEVSAIRGAATSKKDAAVSEFLDAIGRVVRNPSPNGLAQLQDADRKYRHAKKELDRERAANPLPDFPRKCTEDNQ